jgi:hypothetical protein
MNDPVRVQAKVRRQVRRRRRWRRARLTLLILVLFAAAGGAAFGIDRLVVVVHRFYVEHHHSSPRATGRGTSSSTTTTVPPGPPRCNSPQLSAEVYNWHEANGLTDETLSLTNLSTTTCTLAGYPVIGADAANGTPLPATTADVATLGSPGTSPIAGTTSTVPPSPVPLAAGARAWFELSFTNICDRVLQPGAAPTGTPNECYAGTWLTVEPFSGADPLVVTQPLRLAFGTSGFLAGPFEPGTPPSG